MKRLLPFFLFFMACSNTSEEFNPHIPQAKFKEALKAALLIEARANKERVELKKDTIPLDAYYALMYEEQGITKEDFLKTFAQYGEHPLVFEALFEEIANELKVDVDSLAKGLVL